MRSFSAANFSLMSSGNLALGIGGGVSGGDFTWSSWIRPTIDPSTSLNTITFLGSFGVRVLASGATPSAGGGATTRWGVVDSINNAYDTELAKDTLYHLCVIRSSSGVVGYVDGVIDGSAVLGTKGIPDGPSLLIGSGVGNRDFDIAEYGIWDVALDADEITALANGFAPTFIRRSALKFYTPFIRGDSSSDEIDEVGGLSLTAFGTVGVVAHPRIIYPFNSHIGLLNVNSSSSSSSSSGSSSSSASSSSESSSSSSESSGSSSSSSASSSSSSASSSSSSASTSVVLDFKRQPFIVSGVSL
jgi:hypothetical protein